MNAILPRAIAPAILGIVACLESGCMSAVIRGAALEGAAMRAGAGALEIGAGRVIVGEAVEAGAVARVAGMSESFGTTAMRIGSVAAKNTDAAAAVLRENPVRLTTGDTISALTRNRNIIALENSYGKTLGQAELGVDGTVQHLDQYGNRIGYSRFNEGRTNVRHYMVDRWGNRGFVGHDEFVGSEIRHFGPNGELVGVTRWTGVADKAPVIVPRGSSAGYAAAAGIGVAGFAAAATTERQEREEIYSVAANTMLSGFSPAQVNAGHIWATPRQGVTARLHLAGSNNSWTDCPNCNIGRVSAYVDSVAFYSYHSFEVHVRRSVWVPVYRR